MNNPEESPTQKKKGTDQDTSVQTDSPVGSSISTVDDVEIQRHFNELRGELLDKRAVSIDRWLSVIAIVLTFFGVVVAVAGYIGFTRFREIETEAKNSAMTATKHAEDAKHLVDEIKKNRDTSAKMIQEITAKTVADRPEEAKQAAADVDENPRASLIDKAIVQAIFLQQQGKRDEAIEKWRAVAHVAEESDNYIAAGAWFSVGYLIQEEKPEEGISAYNQAISLNPDYAEAYNNRGAAKTALGQHAEAIADYDEAIRLKRDYAKAYNNRGVAKIALGQRAEAIADYDEAIRLKPDYAEAYYHRGVAKGTLDRIDEARQDYEKSRDLARDVGNDSLADLAEQRLRDLDDR